MLTFVQIKPSGQCTGSSGLESDSLKGPHELKHLHFLTNSLESFLVAAGIIEGLRHPPGIQRPVWVF